MLLTFGFANAQSKIYQKLSGYDNYQEVGKYEGCVGAAAYLILF